MRSCQMPWKPALTALALSAAALPAFAQPDREVV